MEKMHMEGEASFADRGFGLCKRGNSQTFGLAHSGGGGYRQKAESTNGMRFYGNQNISKTSVLLIRANALYNQVQDTITLCEQALTVMLP